MGSRLTGARSLYRFDQPFRDRLGLIAGVDEAGRGPLAGPVVAAAVILPSAARIRHLNDSKAIPHEKRCEIYRGVQKAALAIGVGIVDHEEIDELNIYQASLRAMRIALSQLIIMPMHVLVDGFMIPNGPASQTAVIDGDTKSASIAAASIVAKVTRDAVMESLDRHFPGYGFKQHKGYGTPQHLTALATLGPCRIHRRSFSPVRDILIRNAFQALQEGS